MLNSGHTESRRVGYRTSTRSTTRLTASFEYTGPARPDDARAFGVIE
jgi:hypothetical protein